MEFAGRSPKLAAFIAQIGPLDRFDRQAGRSSPFDMPAKAVAVVEVD